MADRSRSAAARASWSRHLTAFVAAFLLLVGAGPLVAGCTRGQSPPQPPRVAAEAAATERPAPAPSATSTSPGSTPDPSPTSAATRSVPTAVEIPRIGVRSTLIRLGLDGDEMQVPSGADYHRAGWFTGSPTPGEIGPAVIAGHVDGFGRRSVFYDLGKLRSGDAVTVTRADGSTVRFVVYRAERYAKDAFPTATVYGNTEGPELRLITCSGDTDPRTGHYRDNTVIYARQR